jgi:6,7-dimethyl-8-ribityllumazine synthase
MTEPRQKLAPQRVIELAAPAAPVRVTIVAARFNRFITDQLLAGALDALGRHGVEADRVTVAWVPGAYELPLAAQLAFEEEGCDGVIALGAVIRGGTPHFDYVAGECSRGLSRVALEQGRPVMFGVLTTDTVEQALERAATDQGNKGYDVALGLLHMLQLGERLGSRRRDGGDGD